MVRETSSKIILSPALTVSSSITSIIHHPLTHITTTSPRSPSAHATCSVPSRSKPPSHLPPQRPPPPFPASPLRVAPQEMGVLSSSSPFGNPFPAAHKTHLHKPH